MATIRVSNIEAKADVSSPTVDEKVKVTSSDGRVLVNIDGKTVGVTSIGINTTGNTFTINNNNITFLGGVVAPGISTFSTVIATSITGVSTAGITSVYIGTGTTAAPSISPTGDSNTGIFFPSPDTIAFGEGGVEGFRLDSSGNVSIANGNLVIGTEGKGIDFSVGINSTGMTSELLSDYEEGTWTPGISGTTGGTYTAGSGNVGRYVKVGNLVTASATIVWTAQPVAYTGLLIITGLPFSALNVTGYRVGGIVSGQAVGIYASGLYNQLKAAMDWNNSFVYIIQGSDTITSGTNYNHTPTVLTTGSIYGFTITYISN
jgi:hypothetical protein